MTKTAVVGMSGGVDSSLSALLLKEAGYRVIGLFMKNWEETDDQGVCKASKEYEDVVRVCEKIDIPYYSVNFADTYREQVFAQFLAELKAGYTPNPDILCNREIKFKVFFEKAMQLGGDFLATGHYCRVGPNNELLRGLDPNKDQSYFLSAVKHTALSKTLFPIGELPKKEVRRLAQQHGLSTHDKKDSTGICFIGKRNFREFISQHLGFSPGRLEDTSGKVVGEHVGLAYYTIGQRHGIGLGGPGEPWFVVGKDLKRNVIIVAQGHDHPALFSKGLSADDISWVKDLPPTVPYRCTCKIRYRQQDVPCTITAINGETLSVTFDTPERAVTPRQSVVFYDGEICLGGARILAE